MLDDPTFERNKNFMLDMFNVVIGIVWQMALTLLPIYLVLKMYYGLGATVLVVAVTSFIIKKTWWDRLPKDSPEAEKKTLVAQ